MQGTGHNATPLGDMDDVVLVRTGAMRGVEIDAGRRVARVEAGAVWADVTAPASEHGLAALAGSAPDVGVVGYIVGGGLGWLGRRTASPASASSRSTSSRPTAGWSAPIATTSPTSSGRCAAAAARTRDRRPGDGAHPGPSVTGGMMLFGWERAREVVQAWREWTADAPETATTSCRIMQVPDMPTVPEFVRGRGVVVIDGAVLGSASEAAAILAPLRALRAGAGHVRRGPAGRAVLHPHGPRGPDALVSEHAMLHALTGRSWTRRRRVRPRLGQPAHDGRVPPRRRRARPPGLGRSGLPARRLRDVRVQRRDPGARGGERSGVRAAARDPRLLHDRPRLQNFAERIHAPEVVYGEASATRLRAVRTAYDPDGLFAGAQSF